MNRAQKIVVLFVGVAILAISVFPPQTWPGRGYHGHNWLWSGSGSIEWGRLVLYWFVIVLAGGLACFMLGSHSQRGEPVTKPPRSDATGAKPPLANKFKEVCLVLIVLVIVAAAVVLPMLLGHTEKSGGADSVIQGLSREKEQYFQCRWEKEQLFQFLWEKERRTGTATFPPPADVPDRLEPIRREYYEYILQKEKEGAAGGSPLKN